MQLIVIFADDLRERPNSKGGGLLGPPPQFLLFLSFSKLNI